MSQPTRQPDIACAFETLLRTMQRSLAVGTSAGGVLATALPYTRCS